MLNTHDTNIRITNFKWLAIVSVIALGLITGLISAITVWRKHEESARQERVRQTLKENSETVRFLENKGQLPDKDVLYYFDAKQGSVYIERGQIRIIAKDTEERPAESTSARVDRRPLLKPGKDRIVKSQHSFTLRLDGANSSPAIRRGGEFGARYNYFLGADSSRWVTGVRAAKELTLEDVYPGVDLRLYSTDDGSLEFDWVMDAGADFSQVKMSFEGQDSLSVDQDGSLKVGLRFTDVKFNLPESYQVTEQGKAQVNFAFNQSDANTIDFTAKSPIDSRYPLIIDPKLTWGTFMDGDLAGFDQYLFAIQVDPADGMVYCAGGSNQAIPTNSAPYDANGFKNSITGFSVTDATPRVAVVYRITGDGTDLVDLTLYGPDSVSDPQETVAYGLSLSSNRVFIGGRTTMDIPLAGTSFDGARNGNDGFVAVFSRDLGTLHYATYLGSSGDENLGVTSVKALSDTSFIVGLTAVAALPAGPAAPDYITTGANLSFGGGSDMYIAKFSSLNALDWGTYVGGGGNEFFSDLEVFADGRVAFAGFGSDQLTEVNSAAGRSTSSDEDGILGVLSSGGGAFNYLDEIGGAGQDRIYDVEIVGSTLYWTGAVSSGFPTSAGVYDTTHNGGLDVVVGSVSAAGGSGYAATFYGGSGNNIGNGIKPVVQTSCSGTQQSFLLVFGSTEGSIPTVNINNEPFYSATNNGGVDIFFAGFKGDLTAPLRFATNMGGVENDYLGDTGDTRGANHLWVSGANVYVGTTTHSPTHSPTLVSGGFDTVKSNTGDPRLDDTHIIFSIQFSSILESDYSDAPASYGAPSHVLDCANLRIGANLDPETGPLPTANADGDDNDKSPDDEDGLAAIPALPLGGPQNIGVTVNNVVNNTGGAATLYAWIDLDGDGQFEAGEFTSTSVANGFSGSKALNWMGVTLSGPLTSHYLRIRLTTDALADNGGTAALDERSTVSALNGEVEDYRLATVPEADLAITKTDGSAVYTPGGTVTYTVVVTNNGPSGVTGAVVTDNKPPQVTTWTWTCSSQTGGASGCDGAGISANDFGDIVNLPVGGSITYTVTANITVSATGDLVNTACVATPQGTTDPTPDNNCATDTDAPPPVAGLEIRKTVNNPAAKTGDIVTFTITVKNNGPAIASDIKAEDILPAEFIFVSATASQGSYDSATGIWTVGALNAGASATLQIRVRVEFGCCAVTNTARIIESSAPDPNAGDNQASVTIGTPLGPGQNLPASSEVSDQKAGSVLVYNFYTSSASGSSQSTQFNITNVSQTTPVAVHMFFVDGETCSVADMFLCLTQNQTVSFRASDLDPGTTGYVVAVAVDCNTGCPIYYNCLIGDEFVKLGAGHRANLDAEAISALTPDPADCDENSVIATLRFNGVKYNRLPRAVALSNIPSRADGNDTMLILNRIGGDLTESAAKLTSIFGIFYDDTEISLSFSFNPNLCQFRSSITGTFPRIVPRFDQFVPKGRSGWLKLYSVDDQAILGVAINSNGGAGGSEEAFNQGHNLHKLTLTSGATLVIPIFPPPCC